MSKKKKKKGIPLVVLLANAVAIVIVIIFCLIIVLKKHRNNENLTEEQSIINIKENITTIESVNLVYGMDGCDLVEILIPDEISEIIAISNDESIVKALIENNNLIIQAVCDDIKGTTVTLTYGGIERTINVYVKPSCLVEFYTDGGTFIVPQMVVYEGNVIRPEDPMKEGYEFVNWYTNEELTEEYDFNLGVDSDMMIYAKFESI